MSLARALAVVLTTGILALTACGSDDAGDGGDGGDGGSSSTPSEEAADAVDFCSVLTVEDVGEVLGGAVTVEEIPGGGCNFSLEDPKAPSAAIAQSVVDDFAGGFDAMRAGVTSMIDGDVEDLDGVGDEAFVVASASLGGESVAGAGGVLLGGTMVQLTLLQSQDLSEDEVHQLTVDVLTLVASKA
jgi:hypothetical protein